MKRLEELNSIASRQLGGLQADDTLFLKIRLAAAEKPSRRFRSWRPVLAVCAALVLVLGGVLALGLPGREQLREPQRPVLGSHSAGDAEPTLAPVEGGNLPQNSLTMSAGITDLGGTLFVTASDGSFPLVTISGATYRLLKTPEQV